MTQCQSAILLACVFLIPAGGCTNKKAIVKNEPAIATLKAEQTKTAPTAVIPRGKMTNAIAAIVNGEVITLFELNREAQPVIRELQKQAPQDDAALSRIRRAALERVIEKKLVEQKTRELNIKVTEDEIRQAIEDVKRQNKMTSQEALLAALASQGLSFEQYRSQLQEQIEKLKLISMEVRAKIHVSESEIREYYDTNRAQYTEDNSYRARHIFFKTNEKSGAEDIKISMKNALMVLAEAKSGRDFIELAKTYSEDPAARKDGGDLGIFKKGDMQPELESAIMSMKPGEVSELVYTPVGFHIIKLEERISGKLKPFEPLKAEIEETIYRKKSEERFGQWAKDLRGKASIEIKDLMGFL
ncbi:MAG: peptidylprolyl isomerase [Desulfuromonadales bacterium]